VKEAMDSKGSAARAAPLQRALSRFFLGREGILLIFLILLATAINWASSGGLLRFANLNNLFVNISIVSVAAIGMTLVILTAGIDVSIGGIVGVSSALAGELLAQGFNLGLCLLVFLASGFALGLLNGLLVSYVRIPPIITTLATKSLFRMLTFLILGGVWISSIPFTLTQDLVLTHLGFLPVSLAVSLVLLVLASLFLTHTRGGRRFYAIGDNEEAARLSGINTRLIKASAYAILGLLTSVAAIFSLAESPLVQNNTGSGFELTVIAAVILGGTELSGGKGTLLGSLLGAIIVALVQDGVILLHIPPFWSGVLLGGVILLSVASSTLRLRRSS
jgi:ribose/xylose/arabinose/galactoside ABC-type transport system permease subunit